MRSRLDCRLYLRVRGATDGVLVKPLPELVLVKAKLSADAERGNWPGMDETAHRLLRDTKRLRGGADA